MFSHYLLIYRALCYHLHMKEKIASFENVSYSYDEGQSGGVMAVSDISFDVFDNDYIALCGHNGSGKSTIAKLLNGLFLPAGDSGQVTVLGLNTRDDKSLFEIRRNCGVVFQNPDNQMVASIIEDDIAFGPENIGLPSVEISDRVDWALKCVDMQEHRAGTPFRLSGGQKQRIAIAGVLAIRPKILVLDEATAMLDPSGREEVLRVVRELHKGGMTVIMITHFMEEAAQAERIIVLNKGRIAMQGGREVLLRRDELKAIGLEVPFAARIADGLIKAGAKLDPTILTIDELTEGLCRL